MRLLLGKVAVHICLTIDDPATAFCHVGDESFVVVIPVPGACALSREDFLLHVPGRDGLQAFGPDACYLRLRESATTTMVPRTWIFGGKAAPGYFMAKLIIRLITGVAAVVNRHPRSRQAMRVVFIPNFSVTHGQRIYPAADLSEQISTPGKEASGTGNMKFQMNGTVTIGTLDGANIEIRDAVGRENFFLFGLTATEVKQLQNKGYRPRDYVEHDAELRAVLELIASGHCSAGDTELFRPLVDNLTSGDPFMVLADFRTYSDCQRRVSEAYSDATNWTRMSILNSAHSGYFTSDRTIAEYSRDIWRIDKVPIRLLTPGQLGSGLLQ